MCLITKCALEYITIQNLFSLDLKSNCTTKFTTLHKTAQESAQWSAQRVAQ